jgi:hypothetical protein
VLAIDHDAAPVGSAWSHLSESLLVVTADGAPVTEVVVAVMSAGCGHSVGRWLPDALTVPPNVTTTGWPTTSRFATPQSGSAVWLPSSSLADHEIGAAPFGWPHERLPEAQQSKLS